MIISANGCHWGDLVPIGTVEDGSIAGRELCCSLASGFETDGSKMGSSGLNTSCKWIQHISNICFLEPSTAFEGHREMVWFDLPSSLESLDHASPRKVNQVVCATAWRIGSSLGAGGAIVPSIDPSTRKSMAPLFPGRTGLNT